jgi:uncharacterized membrane protein YphA (DoxX/SURF4 family)
LDIAATVLAVLLAAFYLFHGYMVLSGHEIQRQNAELFRWPYDRYRLVAIPEIAAGIGLIIGIWYRPLGAAAAFGVVLVMVGAAAMRARAEDETKNIVADLVFAGFAAATGVLQILAI